MSRSARASRTSSIWYRVIHGLALRLNDGSDSDVACAYYDFAFHLLSWRARPRRSETERLMDKPAGISTVSPKERRIFTNASSAFQISL